MPTVLQFGPYRFFFYSAGCAEPPHVHTGNTTDSIGGARGNVA